MSDKYYVRRKHEFKMNNNTTMKLTASVDAGVGCGVDPIVGRGVGAGVYYFDSVRIAEIIHASCHHMLAH